MEKSLKIVMVDDNTDYLFTTETFLSRNGFELCKQLRMDDDLKDIPIIGISGMVDELGIDYKQWPDYDYFKPDAFLDKPVDKPKLLRLIPETIEKAKKRKKRPKWKEKMDKEWAQKASLSQ